MLQPFTIAVVVVVSEYMLSVCGTHAVAHVKTHVNMPRTTAELVFPSTLR